jgi:uncharacterized membrane protein
MTNYRRLTYGGVLGALVFLGTYFLKVPIAYGYIHLGDGMILISSILLGPFAAAPAAVGSALADLISGYAMYAPFTFVIKALMAVVPALMIRDSKAAPSKYVIPFILAEVIMIAGYFLADSIFWGTEGAIAAAPMNAIQAVSGVVIGIIGAGVIRKNSISI